jgi:DNA-binding XRE family transcriptional regulator
MKRAVATKRGRSVAPPRGKSAMGAASEMELLRALASETEKAVKSPMVTIPRKDYDRLRALVAEAEEDAAAARLIARARRELAAGREVLIPLAVADRLADGENPVKVIRQWRKLMQQQLAAAAGITQSYLSGIEKGSRQGPLALHRKLARALDVPLQTLTRDA